MPAGPLNSCQQMMSGSVPDALAAVRKLRMYVGFQYEMLGPSVTASGTFALRRTTERAHPSLNEPAAAGQVQSGSFHGSHELMVDPMPAAAARAVMSSMRAYQSSQLDQLYGK